MNTRRKPRSQDRAGLSFKEGKNEIRQVVNHQIVQRKSERETHSHPHREVRG